jgi:hypothetical protein
LLLLGLLLLGLLLLGLLLLGLLLLGLLLLGLLYWANAICPLRTNALTTITLASAAIASAVEIL